MTWLNRTSEERRLRLCDGFLAIVSTSSGVETLAATIWYEIGAVQATFQYKVRAVAATFWCEVGVVAVTAIFWYGGIVPLTEVQ